MTEQVDTLIIGAGQAGLSTSYHLTQQGRNHVILEQAHQPAEVWRNRWDSFTLNTPNWMTCLPGAAYQGDDPHGFMAKEEVVAYFTDYTNRFDLPVRYGTRVKSVEPNGVGYLVNTDETEFKAANVVMATGFYQKPKIPPFSANLPAKIYQIPASEYKKSRGVTAWCGACCGLGAIR